MYMTDNYISWLHVCFEDKDYCICFYTSKVQVKNQHMVGTWFINAELNWKEFDQLNLISIWSDFFLGKYCYLGIT